MTSRHDLDTNTGVESVSRILIVDDDPVVAESMERFISSLDYPVTVAPGTQEAIEALRKAKASDGYAVVIVDLSLPGKGGMALLKEMRSMHSAAAPIVITGYGTIESAVESIRLGAIDYLLKPVVDEELRLTVEKAVAQHMLVSENVSLRQQLDSRERNEIVGADPRMLRIFEIVESVAPTTTTVLMSGESGTGKSLIAREIHRHSPRAKQPFVEISCGSIPETLLESELFGHVRGAFTGAHADKEGRFLAANGGTIFLDEINSASPGMQLKLLRVLQERKFEPVGSTETVEIDVRVILASNQPLPELVARGAFRQDLYYRINVVEIELPPLRDRVSDVGMLAEHFLKKHARANKRRIVGFTDEALQALKSYTWPGNIRELENVMERAVVLSRTPTIQLVDLPGSLVHNEHEDHVETNLTSAANRMPWLQGEWQPMSLAKALREPEKQIILAALEAHDWSRQHTADALKINRTTLYKKIKLYGLEQYGQAS